MEQINRIVTGCSKQRFQMKEEGGAYYIRATQGHSMTGLDDEALLTRIENLAEVPRAFHGTYFQILDTILQEGLCRMQRRHVNIRALKI